jgi:5'(3')-deoxyribonucleotidase
MISWLYYKWHSTQDAHTNTKSTMKKLKIGLDLDSTLNNLDVAWSQWITEHIDPAFTRDRWTKWELHELLPAGRAVYDYLDMTGTFINLVPKEESQAVVRELSEAGHELYVVTACYMKPGRHHVIGEKIEWIAKHFPEIPTHNICIVQNKSLMRLNVLVDDGAHNFEGFSGCPLLFDGPWNRKDTFWPRVRSWSEAREWFQRYSIL